MSRRSKRPTTTQQPTTRQVTTRPAARGALTVTRKEGESILVRVRGTLVRITLAVLEIRETGSRARIIVEAPRSVNIIRAELDGKERKAA